MVDEVPRRLAEVNLEQRILALTAERDQVRRTVKKCEATIRSEGKRNVQLLKARELLITFASQLQQEFRSEVESLLTMAIRAVFDDRRYYFRLEFKERKDRVEAIPVVLDGRLDLFPKEDMGGGVLPVIGFPLRVILLGGHRPLIWVDEPLKGALGRSDDLFFRAIRMFKEVSERVGIQVIINSHEEDFFELAKTVHYVRHDGKQSIVRRVKPRRNIIKRRGNNGDEI